MSQPESRTLAAAEVEQASEHLQQVRTTLRDALSDVNGAIAALRSHLDEGGGSSGS